MCVIGQRHVKSLIVNDDVVVDYADDADADYDADADVENDGDDMDSQNVNKSFYYRYP